jgi:hypothetical protein
MPAGSVPVIEGAFAQTSPGSAMNRIALLLAGVFVASVNAPEGDPDAKPFQPKLDRPKGWRTEDTAYPPPWAQDLPWKGELQIRFPPGWFDARSPFFWSYPVFYWLEGDVIKSADELEKALRAYDAGLYGDGFEKAKIKIDASEERKTEKRGHVVIRRSVAIAGFDPFVTKRELATHLEVFRWFCPKTDRTAVLILRSPRRFAQEDEVWATLLPFWDGIACHPADDPDPPRSKTAEPPGAADRAIFDRYFHDATMRVDYYHVGDANEEVVALDRAFRQGAWAGSRVHLLDPFTVGRYLVEVTDPQSGTLLFTRRFDSHFGEYRTTSQAAKGAKRTFHESALIPYAKAKVRFAIKVRQRDQTHKTLLDVEIDPDAYTINKEPLVAGVKVFEVQKSGDPHTKVDVAIVAEGYTAGEEAKLQADLHRFAKILFSQEPFASAQEQFNLRGVWKPSEESGCDEPSRGVWRNTALGASFDSLGTERYLLAEDNRALRDIAACAPYDVLYIMVNHPRYGGGGIYNLYCTFTTDNQWHKYLFLHEFGHTFAGLADEYYTSSVAYNDFYPKGVEPDEPNITALIDAAKLKWKDLVTPDTPVPTPWEKAGYDERDLAYQKVREELNARIAAATHQRAPEAEVEKLKEDGERRSREHSDQMDVYLAQSKFVGKVGAFEGAGYASQGLYRPALDCIMFSKGAKPFCPVCHRAIRSVIEHYSE